MGHSDKLEGIDRRKKILEYLETHKKATPKEMASQFLVSEMTIRRDFHYLEEIGVADIHYGGATLRNEKLLLPSFSKRDTKDNLCKTAIGRMAASYVKEWDTIFLDVSSTVFQILRFLPDIHLKIITNSMPIIERLHLNPKVTLFVAPGVYNTDMAGTADLSTLNYIKKFHADKAFIGAMACNLNFGVSSSNEVESAIKYQMWKNSDCSFLMVDHTKFLSSGPVFQNELSDFSYILTDSDIDEELTIKIKRKNEQLIICNV